MFHYFCVVVVVWGVTVQPLMAAIPAQMSMSDNPTLQSLHDLSNDEVDAHTEQYNHPVNKHGGDVGDDSALAPFTMPCHHMGDQVTGDNTKTKACNHCQSKNCASHCIIGSACATSCVASGAMMTMVSPLTCVSARLQSTFKSYLTQSRLSRHSSRIYHPPKST
jgi:hypothetical protein